MPHFLKNCLHTYISNFANYILTLPQNLTPFKIFIYLFPHHYIINKYLIPNFDTVLALCCTVQAKKREGLVALKRLKLKEPLCVLSASGKIFIVKRERRNVEGEMKDINLGKWAQLKFPSQDLCLPAHHRRERILHKICFTMCTTWK